MGEVMTALLTALGNEPRVRAPGIGAGELTRARGGTNFICDAAISQVEQNPVGLPRPHLAYLAGAIKERTMALVGSGCRLIEHQSSESRGRTFRASRFGCQ